MNRVVLVYSSEISNIDLSGLTDKKNGNELAIYSNIYNLNYKFILFIYYENNKILGAGKVTPYNDTEPHKHLNISWIEVIPKYRRKGVANTILRDINDYAIRNKYLVSYCEGPKKYRDIYAKLISKHISINRFLGEVLDAPREIQKIKSGGRKVSL